MNAFLTLVFIAQFATPVALAALGETVGQRAGVLNIGLEGVMLSGCWIAVAVGIATGSCWVGLLAAILGGIAINLIQGLFTVYLGADQVVAGTAINLAGLGITGLAFDFSVAQNNAPSGAPQFPRFGPGFDAVLIALPFLTVLVHWLLFRTEFGLVLRSCGEYPAAAESAGFSVIRYRLIGLAVGGAFAGAAGAYLTLGVAGVFIPNMTVGRGFIAIALVTFGRWKPGWVLAASLLVGGLDWLQVSLQGRANLPVQLFMALPYVAALLVLVAVGKGTQTPQSLGVPYRKVG